MPPLPMSRLLAAHLGVCLFLAACGDKDTDGETDPDSEAGSVISSADTGEADADGGSAGGTTGGSGDSDDGGDGTTAGSDDAGDDGGSGSGVATIYPAEPTTADTLQCLLDGALAVAAGTPVTWTADGVEQVELADGDVSPDHTHTDQAWRCTVQADDERASSEPVTISACGGALQFTVGTGLSRTPSRLATNLTVEAWLRIDGTDQGTFLSVGRGPYHGLDIQYGAALELNYKWGNWNDQWERWYSGTTLHDTGWHHLAVVFEEPDFRVYVDGRYASGTSSPETLRFDGTYGLTVSLSSGMVDELHVTRAVLYNSNFTPSYPLVADSETDALFHLDEGLGTVVVDSGPDAVDGSTTAARSTESAGCPE